MRFLTIMLSLLLFAQTVSAAPFNAKAKTKRIPAGTKFSLQLMNSVSSTTDKAGTEFTAIMMTDQTDRKSTRLNSSHP